MSAEPGWSAPGSCAALLLIPLCLLSLLVGCDQQAAKPPAEQASALPRPIAPGPAAPAQAAVPQSPVAPLQTSASVKQPAQLDLHLPNDLLLPMAQEPFRESAPLLPPMFSDKPPALQPFQLQGRLFIDEDARENNLKALEGAELQLQIPLKR
jgi:hypothetical protein